jgi:hypothetical protein
LHLREWPARFHTAPTKLLRTNHPARSVQDFSIKTPPSGVKQSAKLKAKAGGKRFLSLRRVYPKKQSRRQTGH